MVTMEPPDSTNFFNCGMVLSSLMRPATLLYSGGRLAGSWVPKTPPPPPKPPPKPPPPPPPPRPPPAPPPAPPRRMAPSVNTSTSNLLLRSPASSPGGYTRSNGNSYCSNSQRVQPEGIDPPY